MTRSVVPWLKSKTIQRCTGDLMETRKLCETILYFKVKTFTVLSGQSTLSGGQSRVVLLPPKAFVMILGGLPRWLRSKETACNAGDAGDTGLIRGSGRCPGGGHGNPLQYSCLEKPTDRGSWGPWCRGSQREGSDWAHTHACVILE